MDTEKMKKELQEAFNKLPPDAITASDRIVSESSRMFEEEKLILDAATEVRRRIDLLIDMYGLSTTRWVIEKNPNSGSDLLESELRNLTEITNIINNKYPPTPADILAKAKAILDMRPDLPVPMSKDQYKQCLDRAHKNRGADDASYLKALAENHLKLSKTCDFPFCIMAPDPRDARSYAEGMYVVPA